MKKYFAYGSNLSSKQMSVRCPQNSELGKATLANYKLCFDEYSTRWKGGSATIVQEQDFCVEGIVYNLKAADERNLDSFEMPLYQKITIFLENYGNVFTYIKKLQYSMPPSRAYLTRILEGYSRYNLNMAWLEQALAACCYLGEAVFLLEHDSRQLLVSKTPAKSSYFQHPIKKGKIYLLDFQKESLLSLLNKLTYYKNKQETKRLGLFPLLSDFIPAWYFEPNLNQL